MDATGRPRCIDAKVKARMAQPRGVTCQLDGCNWQVILNGSLLFNRMQERSGLMEDMLQLIYLGIVYYCQLLYIFQLIGSFSHYLQGSYISSGAGCLSSSRCVDKNQGQNEQLDCKLFVWIIKGLLLKNLTVNNTISHNAARFMSMDGDYQHHPVEKKYQIGIHLISSIWSTTCIGTCGRRDHNQENHNQPRIKSRIYTWQQKNCIYSPHLGDSNVTQPFTYEPPKIL